MKIVRLILLVSFIGCNGRDNLKRSLTSQKIAMRDGYRKETKYDSIQLLLDSGKVVAVNFCFPNRLDTVVWEQFSHACFMGLCFTSTPGVLRVRGRNGNRQIKK